ncbi:class I SAM-dependent methyltransferase [Microbacterium sp. nov. GSS16]|uniref:class I SAM-dependent methyltransferase n=1 Tax=Microbacterium sp. nov. GSS16 TaxID=3019890 RepID=UPI002305F3C8|nr:class I SAM-dependent methyltransferase [Microbacterium sp. nov. GSS16]WCD92831.1 class I SAM-dependent methyltransferase [Microbacterium sp. nov. GSS16]
MEMSELTALLTREGLALLDEVGAVESSADVARSVSRLRAAGHSPDLVSAVVGQAHLRVKARAKFGEFADRMLFTRAGLEQATRLSVATMHAVRLRRAGITRVADLGCGIGGDSLAFAGAGLDVDAVDADEVTSAIAAYNLAPFPGASVRQGVAEDSVPEQGAVWLDPARRTAGHSETTRTSPADWSPSLDWCFDVARRHPTGIKLGPGLDRDLIPDDVEAQWVSADGSVVELVLWSGELAREGIRRSALVMQAGQAHEITAPADAADEPVRALGAYLHEPDGAVIRARLIGEAARMLDAGMIDEQIAYLTGDAALTSPFVQSFRVRETMPAHVKTISQVLRAHDIGRLEIKKRGMDIDPAAFRKKLSLKGSNAATLILTRTAARRVAILADRV